MGEVLGPLVDGPRAREMRAHLGEVEADDQLSDDDDGPAPEERRAGQADTQDEKGEDSSRRRDVGEGDREAGVNPQHPPRLLLPPQPPQASNPGTFPPTPTLPRRRGGGGHVLPRPSPCGGGRNHIWTIGRTSMAPTCATGHFAAYSTASSRSLASIT